MPTPHASETRLRCPRCDVVVALTQDEMLQVSRGGEWPRCCLVPMVVEVEDQTVSPDGKTALERTTRSRRGSLGR
jgi:hypothetical protein